MKFQIKKDITENIILSLQPFLEKKDLSSITSSIYIACNEKEIIFKATDYQTGAIFNSNNFTNINSGEVIVNGSNLLNTIKRLSNDIIDFELIGSNLLISQNKTEFKLITHDGADFPSFPEISNLDGLENNIISLNAKKMMENIKKISPAIDNNNPKFELNCALINITNEYIQFVSTDTRRLAVGNIENISNKQAKIIIPKKAIIEISKLFFDDIEILYDDTNLIIKTNSCKFFTKLVNGSYPDYNRIIPTEFENDFLLKRVDFIKAIQTVNSLSQNIKISFNTNGVKNNILIESIDNDSKAKTEYEEEISIDKEISLCANSKYLLDFLNSVSSDKINFLINDSNSPFILKDKDFFTLIVSLNTN
jgi:DNA polymerase-3 subunit beta